MTNRDYRHEAFLTKLANINGVLATGIINTGGGCEAIFVDFNDGTTALLSDVDAPLTLPDSADPVPFWTASLYPADSEATGEPIERIDGLMSGDLLTVVDGWAAGH